jgi:uncharacterized protein
MYPIYSPKDDDMATNSPEPRLKVINTTKGNIIIAEHIEWAGTGARRRRGLLGREALDCMAGVYLIPCEWIHTFGMHFPIDVAFLSPAGRVLAVYHGLRPNRLSRIVLRAEGVLELSAGRLRATNTEVGDQVQFIEING